MVKHSEKTCGEIAAMINDSAIMHVCRAAYVEGLSAEVAAWLGAGMKRYLAGENLDAALRLDRASRMRQCDRALLVASELLDRGRGPWDTAARLEDAIERFGAQIWPRVRSEVWPSLGEIDQALFQAFACRVRMPKEQRGLYNLLAR